MSQTEHVVKVDSYVRDGQDRTSPAYGSYDGIPSYASTGLSSHVFQLIERYVPKPSRILDLGAGAGAMSKRLSDAGHEVVASDLADGNFRPKNIPFVRADLNLSFDENFDGQFDAIVAMEIIEHLENPRHLLRQCKKILAPGGHLFLTTPNTTSAVSIACQLRHGHFAWFSKRDYDEIGHINPISAWHLKTMMQEVNLEIASLDSYGDAFEEIRGSGRLLLLARLVKQLASKNSPQGDILVLVGRKASN